MTEVREKQVQVIFKKSEKTSADDFEVQDFLKKKKKKRKHKEYSEKHENDESIQNVELDRASPLLFEDRVVQSGEGCKKKKKPKNKREKQESLLDNSCVGLELETSTETGVDASEKKKKKKKKKRKYNDSTDEQNDVAVSLHSTDNCQEIDADYVSLKQSVKKKRKEKLPEEDEVPELPTSETHDTNDNKRSKKKKKKRSSSTQGVQGDTDVTVDQSLLSSPERERPGEDTVLPLPTEEGGKKKKKKKKKRGSSTQGEQEDIDVTVDQSLLSSPERDRPGEDAVLPLPTDEGGKKKKKKKKKRGSSTQGMQEDIDVTVDQSLVSSPERNQPGEDTVLSLPTEEGGAATPQQWLEDGEGVPAPATSEDSTDVPANFSKPTKAADRLPQKTPVRARKAKKSKAFVTEESSSESDVMTPEPSASNRNKDQDSSVAETAASDELSLDDEEYLDYTVCPVVDLDTARQELEEFIPHVRSISDSSIRKMAGRDLTRFKQFKKKGIAVKFGRFSQKENDQIRKNIEEFLSITGIDSPEKLLFTSRYPEDKESISRLKAEHLFCEKLSEGIPRPWRLIYYRARKMFDPNNYKGRYTKEEKEKLKKYHAMHGNDWKKISEMMSRSNLSVAMKYSEIKSAINYGPWSKEETQKLMHAMEEVIRKRAEAEDANSLSSSEKSNRDLLIDREKLYQKLPWTEIEAKVGTRYWRQCKQKCSSVLKTLPFDPWNFLK
ncbi:transcription termination factor 1 isoform 2-T2 [Leptosomus discolor]